MVDDKPIDSMKAAFLSRFTPSLLCPEALESTFVQRSKLAQTIVEGLRESSLTSSKHYFLITGPRGIGKTHLVSIIYHRLMEDKDLQKALRVAWLREEEWGVASYLDLLLALLRTIHDSGDSKEIPEEYKRLRAITDASEARSMAEQLLIDVAGTGTLLIIAENLDEIFRGIGLDGQRRLRALIQNHPVFAILGTSQSLFDGVTSRKEPFYGFFDIHQLDELSFENARLLVSRIAEQDGNTELSKMLASPRGRARMRTVHHLAAGNPRVYVIFSQFLTSESLEELVTPLLQTLDDLTPYYQSRMSRLSPQQRKIVEYLCEHRGAARVTEIAADNFITPQTASSQLHKLDELGYVRSKRYGRASYYELRKPLLRLTLEVKKLRGEPVRLIVEFLRVWYSVQELQERFGTESAPEDWDQIIQMRGASEEAIKAYDEVVRRFAERNELQFAEPVAMALYFKGIALSAIGRVRESGETIEQAIKVPIEDDDVFARIALEVVSQLLVRTGEPAWRRIIPLLVEGMEERGQLSALGVGLTQSVRTLAVRMSESDAGSRWLAVWSEFAKDKDQMQIPLRLLKTALLYLEETDDVWLQELPVEEREILTTLLNIE